MTDIIDLDGARHMRMPEPQKYAAAFAAAERARDLLADDGRITEQARETLREALRLATG